MIQRDDARVIMWLIIYLLQAVYNAPYHTPYHVWVSYIKKGAYAPGDGSSSINPSHSGQGCPKYFLWMQSNATSRRKSKFSMYPWHTAICFSAQFCMDSCESNLGAGAPKTLTHTLRVSRMVLSDSVLKVNPLRPVKKVCDILFKIFKVINRNIAIIPFAYFK